MSYLKSLPAETTLLQVFQAYPGPARHLLAFHELVLRGESPFTPGERELIAAYVSIFDSDHTLGEHGNPVWQPQVTAPVRIGRGSWLGERVTVLRGADIGEGCIVGAHSVVKGRIPDHSLAVGAPARVVRSLR